MSSGHDRSLDVEAGIVIPKKEKKHDFVFLAPSLSVRKVGKFAGMVLAFNFREPSYLPPKMACILGKETKIELMSVGSQPEHVINETHIVPKPYLGSI